MKSYWDLSERERAALSTEQVESFVGVEMMNAGVLAPTPLDLLPVPGKPEPDTKLYTLPGLSHSVYFKSEADAALVASLIVPTSTKYLTEGRWSGPSVLVIGDEWPDRGIKTEGAFSVGSYAKALDDLQRAAAATEENKRRSEQHSEQTTAREKALSSMWNDWNACRAKADRMQKVRDTYADYVKLCDGAEHTAAKFLAKAFPQPAIQEAREWFGMEIPAADAPQAAEPKIEPLSAMEQVF